MVMLSLIIILFVHYCTLDNMHSDLSGFLVDFLINIVPAGRIF